MSKKIQNILSLIEIAENNLANAKSMLSLYIKEKGLEHSEGDAKNMTRVPTAEDSNILEVIEGYFDGENMLGDNSRTYLVPQNYASKTQLVIGDRMKWQLTQDKEMFKLIQPAERERVVGQFSMEGDNYIVVSDKFEEPIKMLKASATFAMKNMGLEFGDEVVVIVPKNMTPTWGAFSSVVKSLSEQEKKQIEAEVSMRSNQSVNEQEINLKAEDIAFKDFDKESKDDGLYFDYI
jgi:hypothetical protein